MLRTLFLCPRPARRRASSPGVLAAVLLLAHAPTVPAEERASATAAADTAEPGEARSETNDSTGLRGALRRKGITAGVEVRADASQGLDGGVRRGSAVRGPVLLELSIDTEPLLGWTGGRFYAGFQAHQGRHGSQALVGDAQGFDNVDAVGFRQVSEVWFEQSVSHETLRLRLGKQDANRDFASVESAGDFLNSSAGFSPTIQGFPSYPNPATGLSLSIAPRPWVYSGAGLYDGATLAGCRGRTGNRGPSTLWGDPDALFLIGEAGLRWAVGGLPGRVGAGVWRHTSEIERFDSNHQHGTSGTYVVLEQGLWRGEAPRSDGRSLAVFAQLGRADGSVSDVDRHWSIGIAWTGPIPGRDKDVFGVMVSTIRFTEAPAAGHLRRHETALEAFYKLRLASWAAVQPDIQLVTSPDGQDIRRAVVGTARVELAF